MDCGFIKNMIFYIIVFRSEQSNVSHHNFHTLKRHWFEVHCNSGVKIVIGNLLCVENKNCTILLVLQCMMGRLYENVLYTDKFMIYEIRSIFFFCVF